MKESRKLRIPGYNLQHDVRELIYKENMNIEVMEDKDCEKEKEMENQ